MKKLSWIVVLAIGIVIGAVGALSIGRAPAPYAAQPAPARPVAAAPQAPRPPPPAQAARVPLRADDPAKGPPVAKVTIVEFSDFQCPFCGRVNPTLKALEEAFPGQVRVAWKHQPLGMHPQALPAALAAEAAREQGKFWPFHDLAFQEQSALGPEAFARWAAQLGLDVARFQKAAAAPATKARVEEDMALAGQAGASATPTLFLNCRRVIGAVPVETLRPILEEELRKADALVAGGAALDAGFYAKACDANVKALPGVAEPAAAAPAAPAGPVDVPLRADDPSRGRAGAPVTVVLFSDFQCPFCVRAGPTLKQIEQTWPQDVRIVWKHQPLPMHPEAVPAALAAEAAREQGKFWEMHDRLFEAQRTLGPQLYAEAAKALHLDLARFNAAMADPKLKARVEADQALAARVGVSGTPTFFVNGEKVVGAQPFEAFKAVIERKLKK